MPGNGARRQRQLPRLPPLAILEPRAEGARTPDLRPPGQGPDAPPASSEGDGAVRCPCGADVVPNNFGRHRRGDSCPARPLPPPERCPCGRAWPCLRCWLGPLVQARGVDAVAGLVGLPAWRVYREHHSWRLMHFGPKRLRTAEQRRRWAHLACICGRPRHAGMCRSGPVLGA